MLAAAYAIVIIAGAYQLIAVAACLRFRLKRPTAAAPTQPVSILKPAHSADPGFLEAIGTHLAQNHPDFELLIGTTKANLALPAYSPARQGGAANSTADKPVRHGGEFARAATLIHSTTPAPNAKVGVLIDLAHAAQHEILVVNDADIRVPTNYLARATAPLADPHVGLVTCLYRAHGTSFAARIEALGVATDFAPSALVAPLVGVDEFAFGSTLAFRKKDLARIGGFEAIAPYLADDYQLGKQLHALGLQCVLSEIVVDTGLGSATRGLAAWKDVWKHQVRWARTIRVSRPGGYVGLPITFATLWAAVLATRGFPELAISLLILRYASAAAGIYALQDKEAAKLLPLVPLRDLFGASVWLAGLFGNQVEWRNKHLRLDNEGRIQQTDDTSIQPGT